MPYHFIYVCRECGEQVDTPKGEIAFCPEHPEAVIDSLMMDTPELESPELPKEKAR